MHKTQVFSNMSTTLPSWNETFKNFTHPRVVTMLFLGFSAGLPILLIFSSLSIWLTEAGVKKSVVTYFSWAALGYSFKFIWAPLLDCLPVPILAKLLGRRRSWLLVTQLMVILAIVCMASIDPGKGVEQLTWLAFAAVLLGFSSASQDVVIDAYRIESTETRLQALASATYIVGYRIGMIVAGAGALIIASHYGTTLEDYDYAAWQKSYYWMAFFMVVGIVTTLIINEPEKRSSDQIAFTKTENLQLVLVFFICVSGFVGWFTLSSEWADLMKSSLTELFNNKVLSSLLVETVRLFFGIVIAGIISWVCCKHLKMIKGVVIEQSYIQPVKAFFKLNGVKLSVLLLMIIGFYRVSDIVLGVISNVFYTELGFDKSDIAYAVKTFGLIMTILGGLLGGLLSVRFGVFRILVLGGILSALTNLLFIALTNNSSELWLFYTVVGIDNLSAGLASAAFVAFLSALTNISFTAMQYALFSSLMTLFPKAIGGYSGSMVESIGYSQFFTLTALMGIPVLILLFIIKDKIVFR